MFFDKRDVLMDFGKIIAPISWSTLPPEFMTSLLAFLISLILILIINIKVRNYDPLRKPSGFMNICEIVINFLMTGIIVLKYTSRIFHVHCRQY